MAINPKIQSYLEQLPPQYQEDVVAFLANLLAKVERDENQDGPKVSIAYAMRGMEDEPSEYTLDDLKVRYQ